MSLRMRSGLPPDATDEKILAECLSHQLGETIRAVSIGYDVSARWTEAKTFREIRLSLRNFFGSSSSFNGYNCITILVILVLYMFIF